MANNTLHKAIENIQKTAQADTSRSGQAHVDLLDAVRTLNLAAETPAETLMIMRFEVTTAIPCNTPVPAEPLFLAHGSHCKALLYEWL